MTLGNQFSFMFQSSYLWCQVTSQYQPQGNLVSTQWELYFILDNTIIFSSCWFGHSLWSKGFVIFLHAFVSAWLGCTSFHLQSFNFYQMTKTSTRQTLRATNWVVGVTLTVLLKSFPGSEQSPQTSGNVSFSGSILFVFWIQTSASLPLASTHTDPLS